MASVATVLIYSPHLYHQEQQRHVATGGSLQGKKKRSMSAHKYANSMAHRKKEVFRKINVCIIHALFLERKVTRSYIVSHRQVQMFSF
jgi:hypothetical protein